MSEKNKIILTSIEGQILYRFNLNEKDKAFQKAEELEEMGIEIILKQPSLPETLGNCLGIDEEASDELKKEISEEISSHNSCCVK